MTYAIFENGEQINTIVADAEFVQTYCAENGYTYEKVVQPALDEQPTPADLEAEVNLLKAQIAAQSDQMEFYEDCIAEMAAVVYA